MSDSFAVTDPSSGLVNSSSTENASSVRPKELDGVGIDEQLGHSLDLNLKFKNENGQEVTLGAFINGSKPVIISPVYFSCPGLCNFHLNGFTEALKEVDWTAGKDFTMIALSFDSKETPDMAMKKKSNYLKIYDRPAAESGWHFLTGDEESVKAFTKSIGFKYKWNEEAKEWSHVSAAIVVSPQGKISRYLPGIMFDKRDVKLALTEAAEGKIGNFVDSLILYCFHYDPQQSKYTIFAGGLMKMGGSAMLLLMLIWLIPIWFKGRKKHANLGV
ncbi:MAG TPA: SCO family protein [Pseudobdellovibrionaceae bacterium]|nr:SCO family protein [Pseudobdellovibrionaceae bacterium]